MALPPRFAGHRLGSAQAAHTLEFYWDFTCPYSAKSFHRIYRDVFPYLEQLGNADRHRHQVQILFRHQVQPWHPQSTLLHEAALAVERVCPRQFFAYAERLFAAAPGEYYDAMTYDKSRSQLYQELARLAGQVPGVSADAVLALLQSKSSSVAATTATTTATTTAVDPNGGNAVTEDLKWHLKVARQQSIHVSPTVLVDGLADPSISSSWTLDQWKDYLQEKLFSQ